MTCCVTIENKTQGRTSILSVASGILQCVVLWLTIDRSNDSINTESTKKRSYYEQNLITDRNTGILFDFSFDLLRNSALFSDRINYLTGCYPIYTKRGFETTAGKDLPLTDLNVRAALSPQLC